MENAYAKIWDLIKSSHDTKRMHNIYFRYQLNGILFPEFLQFSEIEKKQIPIKLGTLARELSQHLRKGITRLKQEKKRGRWQSNMKYSKK